MNRNNEKSDLRISKDRKIVVSFRSGVKSKLFVSAAKSKWLSPNETLGK